MKKLRLAAAGLMASLKAGFYRGRARAAAAQAQRSAEMAMRSVAVSREYGRIADHWVERLRALGQPSGER